MSTLGIKQVIVARRDLEMPPGTVVAIGPDTDGRIDPVTGHLELY